MNPTHIVDRFAAFLDELRDGDRPNLDPVCQRYGCREDSPTAILYAGFVAGWYAGVIDMGERPDQIRKELDL